MINFDGGARELCITRRIRTNTPLQALNTLNDSAYLVMARNFAYRMNASGGNDIKIKLKKGYEAMLYKQISETKLNRLIELYNQAISKFKRDKEAVCEMIGVNDDHNSPEIAALVVVANAMLNLDEPDSILKGCKDGKVIVAGKADASELIERIFLAKDNEDHMPPKQKPQLSKQDLDLLHWWVSSGADFNKRVSELTQTPKIKPVLLALQSGVEDVTQLSDIPATIVEKANEAAIQKLKDRGVTVTPFALNSNYLEANFVTVDSVTENDLKLLEPLRKQLIWLKLGGKKITDANLTTISKLSSLTRLYLDRTMITDVGLNQVKNLLQLQYINLVGTGITGKGLEQLKGIKNLRQVFIYQTGINSSEYLNIKKIFPETNIDTGRYKVQMLETDTMEKKAPVKINN